MSDTEQQPLLSPSPSSSTISKARHETKTFLTSKYGHYTVLALVSLDVTAIFAELLIQLLTCEGHIERHAGEVAGKILSILSVVFSSLFMLELLASIWAFGSAYVMLLFPVSSRLDPYLWTRRCSFHQMLISGPRLLRRAI